MEASMSSHATQTATEQASAESVSAWMILLLAAACGLIVGNVYYAQPLIGLIAPAIGLDKANAGLIVGLTQGGYCVGLLLLAPLGDLVENRRLIVCSMSASVLALLLAAVAPSAPWFLAASLLIGVSSVSVQMLVPIAAHLAPDEIRGRVVGNVMGGLLLGIMLARPMSSLVANYFGWRTVFGASAILTASVALALRGLLPVRQPNAAHNYATLIGSLWRIFRDMPVLRRRAAYQTAQFAAFGLFWTAVPLELAGPTFGLTQRGIAFFALAGAAGALSAPIAGRLADRGWSRVATGACLTLAAISFVVAWLGGNGSLVTLLAAGILLDMGVQANQILGQRAIYALGAESRSRLNGLYVAIFFAGGAVGSATASIAYARGGWSLVCLIGLIFPLIGLAFFATEFRRPSGNAGRRRG
jgi:predicted MFS family arabinose efflux permease